MHNETSGRQATINDVAAHAGVSIKTVSRVLNGERYVAEATKDVVLAAAAMLGYTPSFSARNLARGTSRTIGLAYATAIDGSSAIIPHYSQAILSGTLDACRTKDFGVLMLPCDRAAVDPAKEILREAKERRISGLIVAAPICNLPGILPALRNANLPFVCIGPDELEQDTMGITINNREACFEMTRHILALGHRRIAFIKGNATSRESMERLAGFKQAMNEAQVEVDPELIVTGNHMFECGFACGQQLLDLKHRPTAIFASNDDMAVGVMHAAYARGLSLPRDLSVAGFDDSGIAKTIWPQLTTVHQPLIEMASAAVNAIVNQTIASHNGLSFPAQMHYKFDCGVVVRGSLAVCADGSDERVFESERTPNVSVR